ncbi:uncharacterized protein LOC129774392 [Toxorhynchites rutilus septentrionalis]|uniref:uncharacterized protein LOC129774392 n=1 Tax=Toxorhynchites rutilus septentrionalis TaxID=329112 RepID=UPI002479B8C3|nr:uncharacterized protein LOC129774392 [Toxorhynchites rutilus septentrionalis]
MIPSHHFLTRLATHSVYYGASFCGFLPFRYATDRFVWSRVRMLWSLCAGICSIVLIGYSYYHVITPLSFPSLEILRYLLYWEYTIRISVIVSCYLSVWINYAQLRDRGSDALEILAKLQTYDTSSHIGLNLTICGLLKIAFGDILICCILGIISQLNFKNDPVPTFQRLVNIYSLFVVAQVSNVCVFSLSTATYCYGAINRQISRNCSTVVCKELDVLSRLHYKTTDTIQGVCNIFGVSLALINFCQFLVIISRVYYVYVWFVREHRYPPFNSLVYLCFEVIHLLYLASVSHLLNRKGEETLIVLNEPLEFDVDIAVERRIHSFSVGLLLRDHSVELCGLYKLDFPMLFSAFQFFYIVSGSTLLTNRAEKTGLLLNRFFKADIEERVEKTIEMFSIELLHQTYSIESFGMFKVDFTLMYSMVASITSYLIIMVQFQLTE